MKKKNKKTNKPNKPKKPVVLVLYGISIVLSIYAIFTIYNSYTYISSLVPQGLVISDELESVIAYFGNTCIPYIFYSISIWSIGYIISKLDYIICETKRDNREDIKEEIIITDSDEK